MLPDIICELKQNGLFWTSESNYNKIQMTIEKGCRKGSLFPEIDVLDRKEECYGTVHCTSECHIEMS